MEAPAPRGPRLRELGLRIGALETGRSNAITDVPGVAVGHVTVWRDEPDPPAGRGVARTGVTAIVPGRGRRRARPAARRRYGRAQRRRRADELAPDGRVGNDRDRRVPDLDDGRGACLRRRGGGCLRGGPVGRCRSCRHPRRGRMRRQLAERRTRRPGRGRATCAERSRGRPPGRSPRAASAPAPA